MSIAHNRVNSEAGFSIESGELRNGAFIREDTADTSNMIMNINESNESGSGLPASKFSH